MLEKKDVSIERRKYEIAKEIRTLGIEYMFYRSVYLRDNLDMKEKAYKLLDEFNYLCELSSANL